jgi:S-phase kinase-associated protein 1
MGVTFITSDFQRIDADNSILEQSVVINDIVEDIGDGEDIPLPTISSKALTKILDYCSFHNVSHLECEIRDFNKEFVKIDVDFIFELIQGANFLNIRGLLDVLCLTVADMIKGKTPEQIRGFFGIDNEITPEEEAAALAEHSWTQIV